MIDRNHVGPVSWFLTNGPVLLALLMLGIMSARIVQTHKIFSGTYDESTHIASGVELLTLHRYTYSLNHTPIARVSAAIGPVLAGARFPATPSLAAAIDSSPSLPAAADSVMHSGPGYRRNLELGRRGIVPFFILSGLFLFFWARRIAGDSVAVVAVFLFSLTPPILAHSGLVTTDAAAMASFTALMFAFQVWLEQPASLRRALWLGIASGAAVGSKLSAIPFFGGSVAVILLAQFVYQKRDPAFLLRTEPRIIFRRLAAAGAVALITLYATYGFTIGRALGFPAPLSEFVLGLMLLLRHNVDGNAGYLLGEFYVGRRWLFFPVGIAVKTPIPLLIVAVTGIVFAVNKWWNRKGMAWFFPIAAIAAPLAVACASRINLGTRHILPIFPAMALLGGIGGVWMFRRAQTGRMVAVLLAFWMLLGTWRAHPDYIAYFNELAANDPGAILIESDLDWGQDLERLADTVRARGITSLSIAYYGYSDRLNQLFPNARLVGPNELRPTGWFAVSETRYRRGWIPLLSGKIVAPPDSLTWLRQYKPIAWAGKSIRLYFVPPPTR
jgi:hypothetical protein